MVAHTKLHCINNVVVSAQRPLTAPLFHVPDDNLLVFAACRNVAPGGVERTRPQWHLVYAAFRSAVLPPESARHFCDEHTWWMTVPRSRSQRWHTRPEQEAMRRVALWIAMQRITPSNTYDSTRDAVTIRRRGIRMPPAKDASFQDQLLVF